MYDVTLRRPCLADGPALHRLVKRCPPLDENSRYCNLLQVTHFRDTSVIAEYDGQLAGFVTGYRVPGRENVLFIWQVGVSPEGRGQRLAGRMLTTLLERLERIDHLETTVGPGNDASRTLFERMARELDAPLERSVLFDRTVHFEEAHDDEVLYRIGPFDGDRATSRSPQQNFKETGT